MMKAFRHIGYIILAFAMLTFSTCATDDTLLSGDGESVSVTFRPTLAGGLNTRAIGDAEGIDRLQAVVYEGSELSRIFSISKEWYDVERNGITLTLIKGRSYKILFWADDKDNSAYDLTDNGKISVDYTDYINGGFSKMEEMDAFYGVSNIIDGLQNIENNGIITLIRPFAQLNFADNSTNPQEGIHQAVVTFHSIPESFNPFTGKVSLSDTEDVTFTFKDFPAEEKLNVDGTTYYYVSSNYLLAPSNGTISVSATLDLQQTDGTTINKLEFKGENAITLEKNKKTNVLGPIVEQHETWSVWDGVSKSQPATDNQNRYIIDEATDIAWLAENGATLNVNSTFLQTKDIDMNGMPIASIKLPAGSTYDGGGKTIKNYTNSLFGDAVALIVKDFVVENITVSGTNHTGTLVNTLKGSSSFTNVSVTKASVTTTSGAAGGMVGYVVRQSENNTDKKLNVTFDNCHVVETIVSGSASQGHFVGLLSGYDNGETLTFKDNCTLTLSQTTTVADDFVSPYTEGNEGAWLAANDYTKYNGWLGNEEYYRGQVYYGDNRRFIPRWDGKTIVEPLLYEGDSNKYVVYSPFDLAGIRDKTPSPEALYLMENVDMNGQGADGKYNVPSNWKQSASTSGDDHYFMSFSSIAYLNGNKKGIYNLNINTQEVSPSLYYGGFIQSTSGTTKHEDINFHNCCVVVPLVVYKNEDKGSAGMLVSNIAGDYYTMNNVHTYGCKIFALQKVGGLAARVAATTSVISNCSVNDCYIENYEHKGNKEGFSKSMSILGNSVTVSSEFYSYGEVGGMFGFVENNTSVEYCDVNNTIIHAYGQDDTEATIKGSGIFGKLAEETVQKLGYFLVPGRHVSTFIGDIRTSDDGGDQITISNCNVTNTNCTNRYDNHNNTYTSIGQAYYVFMMDKEGSVSVDGNKLTLANCNKNTSR